MDRIYRIGPILFILSILLESEADWVAGVSPRYGTRVDGTLWCWGNNDYGQLGDGTDTSRTTPTYVDAGTIWVTVSAGGVHSCGIMDGGTVWCWGQNYPYGQLGDGTTDDKWKPTYVDAGTNWASVSAGEAHNCGTKTDGTIWCWGYNGYGQLGDGTNTSRWTPTYVDAGAIWASISAGQNHTCGIRSDGTLWCWGRNWEGQLGDGTNTARETPTYVDAGTIWASMSAGQMHTCGTKSDGTLWCWGWNLYAQLGDGTTTQRLSPTYVDAGETWASVSAGYTQSCGTKSDGTLWCWGYNANGQLGYVTTVTKQKTPAYVDAGTAWASVSAGRNFHACGTKNGGTLWCWGYNYQNVPTQVGD